jgi:type IV secretory pathway VirB3-like protein
MNRAYPSKAIIFLALTRPAMVWGVSIEYLFVCLVTTLSLIILTDHLSYSLIGLFLYLVGRVIFYWDHHLMTILFRFFLRQPSALSRQLGRVYYDLD